MAYSFIRRKPIRVSGRRPVRSFVKVFFIIWQRPLNCCITILKSKNTFYNFLELVVLYFSWSCLYFKHFTLVVINSFIWFFKNFMVVLSLIEPPFIFDLWQFLFISHLWKYLCQIFNMAYSKFCFLLSGWRHAALAKTALSRGNFFCKYATDFSHFNMASRSFFCSKGDWGSSGDVLFLHQFLTCHLTGFLSL